MQLSKNAIGNLINRYKAVLKKSHLLNIFGSLAFCVALGAGALALPASAEAAAAVEPNFPTTGKYHVIEVEDPDIHYFKTFSVNDGSTTTNYGMYFINPPSSSRLSSGDFLALNMIQNSFNEDYTITRVSEDRSTFSVPMVNGTRYFSLDLKNANLTRYTSAFAGVALSSGVSHGYFADIPETAISVGAANNDISILNVDFFGGKKNAIVNSGGNIKNIDLSNFVGNAGVSYGAAVNNAGRIDAIINSTFVANSAGSYGGAVYNASSRGIGSFINVDFIGNRASYGGAVGSDGSIGKIDNNNFAGNSADYSGGAVYLEGGGSITDITNSTFAGNSADVNGGAVYLEGGGSITDIYNSTFAGNSAGGDGGAVWNEGIITTITDATFAGNSADVNGGAVFNSDRIDTITDTSFSGNSADGDGGAVLNKDTINVITDATFCGNSAGGDGGAVFNAGTITTITDATFSGNSAEGNGGAVFNSNYIEAITNSIFSGNSAGGDGGAVYNEGGTIGIVADAGWTYFSKNTANGAPNAIHSNGGTLNLSAENAGVLHVTDPISGETLNNIAPIININRADITANGWVIFRQVDDHNIALDKGTLSFADGYMRDSSALQFNSEVGSVLYMDVDLANVNSDTLTVPFGQLSGTVAFRMWSETEEKSTQMNIFTGGPKPTNAAAAYTNNHEYTYSAAGAFEAIALDFDGFSAALNGSDVRTFSLTDSLDLSNITIPKMDDIGTLTIFGNMGNVLAEDPIVSNNTLYGHDHYILSSSKNKQILDITTIGASVNIMDAYVETSGLNNSGTVLIYNSYFSANTTIANKGTLNIVASNFAGNLSIDSTNQDAVNYISHSFVKGDLHINNATFAGGTVLTGMAVEGTTDIQESNVTLNGITQLKDLSISNNAAMNVEGGSFLNVDSVITNGGANIEISGFADIGEALFTLNTQLSILGGGNVSMKEPSFEGSALSIEGGERNSQLHIITELGEIRNSLHVTMNVGKWGAFKYGPDAFESMPLTDNTSILALSAPLSLHAESELLLGVHGEQLPQPITRAVSLAAAPVATTAAAPAVLAPTSTGTGAEFYACGDSLTVINVNALGDATALTAEGGNGLAVVDAGAQLFLMDIQMGDTVKLLEGFNDPGSDISPDAWSDENFFTDNSLLSVELGTFDPDTGSMSVKVEGSSKDDLRALYPKALETSLDLMVAMAPYVDADSLIMSHKFYGRIFDNFYLGANQADLAISVFESSLQTHTLANAFGIGKDVANVFADALQWRMSRWAGKNAPAVQMVENTAQKGEQGLPAGSMSGQMADNSIKNAAALWLSPLYSYKSGFGRDFGNFEGGYDSSLGGLALGVDYTFSDAFRIGAALSIGTGYSESTGDMSNTSNDFDFWGLSLYGAFYHKNFTLMADVGISSVFGEVNQDVPSAMLMSNLDADLHTTVITAGLRAEYTFNTAFADITPHVGVRYMYVHTYGYDTEMSGSIISHTKADTQSTWYFPVGVTFSKDIESESGWTFTPSLDVGFVLATGDVHASAQSSIPSVNDMAKYSVRNVDTFAFDGGLGFDLAHKESGISFGLNYNILASEHETGHMLNATFKLEF